jgi:hypothetical protein
MTCTYCCTNALARLLWSSVFYPEVLIRLTPSLFGKISRFKNAFIKEYKMASFLRYLIQSIVKSNCFIFKLFNSLFFPSRNIADLNLPLFHSCKLHYLEQYSSFDSSIRKLTMKHDTSPIHFQNSPFLLILLARDEQEFLI